MSLTYREKLVIAALESTYGTDATPAGTNAVQTQNLTPRYYEGDTVAEETDRSIVGGYPQVVTAPFAGGNCNVYIKGSGGAGVAPNADSFLRMAGFDPTITASTSVIYNLVAPADMESGSVYFYRSTQYQRVLGARANMELDITSGQLPRYTFDYTGLYLRPVTQSIVTPTYNGLEATLPVNNTTTTLTLGGVEFPMYSLQLNLNNQIARTNIAGLESVDITDREVTGTLRLRAPAIATKDFFADVESHVDGASTQALFLIVSDDGTTSTTNSGTATDGKVFELSLPQTQLTSIGEEDVDGVTVYSFELSCVPTASGNDEAQIAYR